MQYKYKVMMIMVAVCLMASPLGACGVKPGKLPPPKGSENTGFPHTYPEPVSR